MKDPLQEEIIQVSLRLARAREEVTALEDELTRLIARSAAGVVDRPSLEPYPPAYPEEPITRRVLRFFQDHHLFTYTVDELARVMPELKVESLRMSCDRLAARMALIKPRPGQYRLTRPPSNE